MNIFSVVTVCIWGRKASVFDTFSAYSAALRENPNGESRFNIQSSQQDVRGSGTPAASFCSVATESDKCPIPDWATCFALFGIADATKRIPSSETPRLPIAKAIPALPKRTRRSASLLHARDRRPPDPGGSCSVTTKIHGIATTDATSASPNSPRPETPLCESNTRPAETDATKRVPPVLYGENDTRHTTYVCRLSILLSFPAFQLFSWCEAPRFSADAKHLHSRAEIGRRVKLQNTETPRGESKIRPVPRFPGYSVITWK